RAEDPRTAMSPQTLAVFDMVQRAERAGDQPVSVLSRIVGRGPALGQADGGGPGGLRLRFCALRAAALRERALCHEPALLSRAASRCSAPWSCRRCPASARPPPTMAGAWRS